MDKNVLLIGLKNNNLGDSVILETCNFLLKKIDNELNISYANLFPNKDIMDIYKKFIPFYGFKLLRSILKRLNFNLQMPDVYKWKNFVSKNKNAKDYYNNCLKNISAVVIAGGGLIKYSREDFWNPIDTITSICVKKNIPVYFNAVGIEGFDEKNYRCKFLSKSLSRKNVLISTRDDLETLKKYLLCNKEKACLVGDPALYTVEAYGIEANRNSEVIGLGIIRGKIYTDYGTSFNEENIVEAYVNIIKSLEKNNYKWQMFCNGIESDYKMGEKILEALNLPNKEQYLVKRPVESIELISTISNYKAIIAARLHANIIATSLGIPSVGLVWNDKLKLFGKLIGCENRFVEKENFIDAEFVIKQLEEAILNGYNEEKIKKLKILTLKNLEIFINNSCKILETEPETRAAVERERESNSSRGY